MKEESYAANGLLVCLNVKLNISWKINFCGTVFFPDNAK